MSSTSAPEKNPPSIIRLEINVRCIFLGGLDNERKFIYAEEVDVLNVALFGMTAKEWGDANPELSKNGNIRDYTDLLHLVILNNLENINDELMENNISQSEGFVRLNNIAKK